MPTTHAPAPLAAHTPSTRPPKSEGENEVTLVAPEEKTRAMHRLAEKKGAEAPGAAPNGADTPPTTSDRPSALRPREPCIQSVPLSVRPAGPARLRVDSSAPEGEYSSRKAAAEAFDSEPPAEPTRSATRLDGLKAAGTV